MPALSLPPAPSTAASHDTASPRLVLTSLCVTMLLVLAYLDIVGVLRADALEGALAGTMPSAGYTLDRRFPAIATLYVLVPSLMVAGSTLLPRRVQRTLSVVLAGGFTATIVAAAAMETWVLNLVGTAVAVVPLAVIVGVARRRQPVHGSAAVGTVS